MKTTNILRSLLVACTVALGAVPTLAGWEARVINPGGLAGGDVAISSQTSRVYWPDNQRLLLVGSQLTVLTRSGQ